MARKISKHLSNEKAFTLIEMIVSLVLVGILAAIAGMGLVQIAQGYVLAKQAAETVQKVQVAMARMDKEMGAITSISTAPLPTNVSLTYTRPTSIGSTTSITNTLTISGSGSSGLVHISGATSGTLINNVVVASSSFTYYDGTGAQIASPTAATVTNIRRIDINLTVSGAGIYQSAFNSSVFINEPYN